MKPMYVKSMDTVAEEMEEENLGINIDQQRIPALVFMDDLTSMAEGYEQQERTLESISNFGVKHKIEWKIIKIREKSGNREKQVAYAIGVNRCSCS